MKNISHAIITKVVVFIIAIVCFIGAMKAIVDTEIVHDADFSSINEDGYFQSWAFIQESQGLLATLSTLIGEYKSEEYILSGKALTEEDITNIEEDLFSEFYHSNLYNYQLSETENHRIFQTQYADKIALQKEETIKQDVRQFYRLLDYLESHEGFMYYASNGEQVFSNSAMKERAQFESFAAYMIFEDYKQNFHPAGVKENPYLYQLTEHMETLDPADTSVIYVAFTESFLNEKKSEWGKDKTIATNNFYKLIIFSAVFLLCLAYLIVVIGRTAFGDTVVHFQHIDKLYNDINIALLISLTGIWIALMDTIGVEGVQDMYILITVPIFTVGLLFILSLIKHIKNRTILKHTLIYRILYTIFCFVKQIFDSGSIGVRTALLIIAYPLLVAATFFMFPITIGFVVWLAMKKVKSFNRIKEGVEHIKAGDLQHRIEVHGKGEFGKLAANINSITDGLKTAVDNEIKSERLKTELITNVSHDIRTPLTSIITYVDLLKTETDSEKIVEYIEVLDQKSKRLKLLTDDLFEAAKASSGSIPVQFERIDIISLLTQGIGEMDEKIEALALDIKLRYPNEKVYMKADGKLLWRSIENLFSNIFKYALPGSRVYIDVEDSGDNIVVTFKNMSAYELNISADELMERFKRGDESRSSQGSGLGLSIAKSLIDIQHGTFIVQVDGDLFKTMISIPKYQSK